MEKVDCGEILHKWLDKKNVSQKWLAEKIDSPEGTVSSWIGKKDIKISNISKICFAINIKVWQFFAPDDIVLPQYTPEQKQFFKAFNELPKELQGKALDILEAYLDAFIAGKEAK